MAVIREEAGIAILCDLPRYARQDGMNVFGYILLLLGLVLFNLLYVGVHAIVGRMLELPLTAIILGVGPTLLHFRLLGIETSIKPIPLTADVTFGTAGQPDALENAPWYKKAALSAGGLLGVFAVAFNFLGQESWPLIWQTWAQVLDIFRQWGGPLGLADATARQAHDAGIMSALGLVIAKLTEYNALPLPSFNGGRILLAGIEAIIGQQRLHKFLQPLLKLSILASASIFVAVLWREFLG
jgi:hypothetical protein